MQTAVVIMPDGTPELYSSWVIDAMPASDFHPLGLLFDDANLVLENARNRRDGWPIVSRNIRVQAAYIRMREKGESHNMAEMLATRKFPGVKTDAVFNEGKFSGQDMGHAPAHEAWLRAQAQAAGVSTNGKWYCSGLASFPGDPTAWIGDRGDALRVAREKNMTMSGYVEHQGHEVEPTEDVDIAPEILSGVVDEYMTLDSGERRADVESRLRDVLTGKVDNNPLLVTDSGESPC